MKEEKNVTPVEETENAQTTSKHKSGKKSKIIICLSILLVVAAAVFVCLQVVFKDKDKRDKESSVVDGKFNKTTYFYNKVVSDMEGPVSSYFIFDKDGKYVSISISPNPFGEAGKYSIDGEEITLTRKYLYTTSGGLKVSDPTTETKNNVNLGSYKGDEIIIYGNKAEKVEESKFKKGVDEYYTFDDIEKAFEKHGGDNPVVPDKDEDDEPIPSKPSKCVSLKEEDYYPRKCTMGSYEYTLKVIKEADEDAEEYYDVIGIFNNKDQKIAEFKEYPDNSDDVGFNDDGSVYIAGAFRVDKSLDNENQIYIYKINAYTYDGKKIDNLKIKEATKITDNYIMFVESGHLKLADYKGNVVNNFDFKLDGERYVLHPMLSGWFTEKGKNGIYFVIEDTSIEFGEDGAGLEYYYIPSTKEVGTIKTDGVGGYAKPVLYLYPEKETKIKVSFEKPGLLTTTYPKFKNSWEVVAKSNGDLKDKDGKYYYGLYWEEKGSTKVDFTEGFYVTKDNAIKFLEEKLNFIGLNDKERNEFIMYWLPILEKNGKSVVYFELTEERNEFNKLIINPTPDSLLRVAIHVKKVSSKPSNLKEEKLAKFNRSGFAAIEWGGVIH